MGCWNSPKTLLLLTVLAQVVAGFVGETPRHPAAVSSSGARRDDLTVSTFSVTTCRGSTSTTRRSAALSSDKNLLSVEECLELYHATNNSNEKLASTVKFMDGSWFHKGKRNGRSEFATGPRIPGSVYFDLDDISCKPDLFPDQNPARLSQMQPPPQLIAAYMDACGISNSDRLIVYGQAGCSFLPRLWFTLRRVMGHERVHLMQGSLQDWIALGGPVDLEPLTNTKDDSALPVWAKDLDLSRPTRYQVENYSADSLIVDLQEMKTIVMASNDNNDSETRRKKDTLILDTRGSSFAYGHMPGAVHIPYSSLSEPDNPNRLKPVEELRQILQDAITTAEENLDNKKRVVLSCGSGVSVCNLYLAMEECGYTTETTAVYDGSWEEWRMHSDLPKVVSAKSDPVMKQ